MGGTSTLQGAVLSDETSVAQNTYDLRSWQGLTYVLKVGKEKLEPGVYAEFRNLVLQYAQQGGDKEIKKQIDTIVATFDAKPSTRIPVTQEVSVSATTEKTLDIKEVTKEKEIEKKVVGRRVVPQFGTRSHEEADTVAETPTQNEQLKPEVTKTVVESDPVQHPPVMVSAPPPQTEAQVPVTTAPKTLEEYRVRITQIKRAVHERVGNPVALMGMKDGRGKAYMTALLEALKATSAGSGGSADGAMLALESAYAELFVAQGQGEVKEYVPDVAPNPTNPVSTTPHTSVEEKRVEESKKEVTEKSVAIPVTHEESIVSESTPQAEQDQKDHAEVLKEEVSPIPNIPGREAIRASFTRSDSTIASVVGAVERNRREAEEAKRLSVVIEEEMPIQETKAEEDGVVASEVPMVEPSREDSNVGVMRHAPSALIQSHEEPLRESSTPVKVSVVPLVHTPVTHNTTPSHEAWAERGTPPPPNTAVKEELGVDPKAVAVKQAELSSPEVAAMLDKLLHDWSIFSGSGLFGIGPGGLDHPLFRKLAPLSMGEVLAGRWEGTNPKTVKIIKQYVDAWRHEQAITYTEHETFEHYLRRVVQRILKRQSG